jgi:hypothetical protein
MMAKATHLAGDSGALQKGGGPGPLGDNGRGGQPDGDLATRVKGRVQVIGIVVDVLPNLHIQGQLFSRLILQFQGWHSSR